MTLSHLLGLAGLAAWLALAPAEPLALLERPEIALDRVVSRELDLRAALDSARGWERTLYELRVGLGADPAELAAWYDDLGAAAPAARFRRLLLAAEAGTPPADDPGLAALAVSGPLGARMAAWLEAAYGPVPPGPETAHHLLEAVRTDLEPGWFADTLARRLAERAGHEAAAAEAARAIEARGQALLRRWQTLGAAEVGVVVAGLAALGLAARRGRRLGPASLPPPWPLEDGVAVFVLGAFWFLALGLLAGLLPPASPAAVPAGLLGAGPFLWWTYRWLRARGESPLAVLGLAWPARGGLALAAVTLAAWSVSLLGELAIGVALARLSSSAHWAEGLSEALLAGPAWRATLSVLETAVWAPVVEEVAFRAVLYGSLRRRLRPGSAAVVSALVFAVAHDYGVGGLLQVAWSGVVWALAYERTGSLLPAVLAHALNNLTVALTQLWLLRL